MCVSNKSIKLSEHKDLEDSWFNLHSQPRKFTGLLGQMLLVVKT